MNNINIRLVGTANMSQMGSGLGQIQTQVQTLNAQLAETVALQKSLDGAGFTRVAAAAAVGDKAFRANLATSGMFEQQQLRLNKATDDYVEKLKKQKLSFRDMRKERAVAAAAYRDQIAMENMVVRQGAASASASGAQKYDVIVPKEVSSELDTAAKRMAWFNEQVKSGAHQMVNWGKNTQWAGRQLTVGLTMPLLAAGAAAGVLAYKLDQEFTRIQKVYDTTADATSEKLSDQLAVEKELKALREAGMNTAIMAAKNYGASAQDTLNVQAELAATGAKGAELQKVTAEVMRISRLGELDYQNSIKTTIALQSVFKMSNEELTDTFNYMNSIENATSLATADFAAAIPIASAPIKAFGGDIHELGTLLTAMKERGIDASEGANAIKAAMQRLYRPSAQIKQEFMAITGQDIGKIVEESGSLTEVMQKIGEATEGLSRQDKGKAFAGLFGTYQVTRLGALVEGMNDLEAGVGQVTRANEIAGQSTGKWASTADKELERLNESISGKFQNALAQVQIQLSTLGEPFVQVASVVLNGISMLIQGFNSLPGPLKVILAAGLGLAAIAGPVIMLVGLFANLFGNLLKGGATIAGLFAKMNILGTGERAAALAAEFATSKFVDQRTATQMLTAEINKMTEAQMRSAAATRHQALMSMPSAERQKMLDFGTSIPLDAEPMIDKDGNVDYKRNEKNLETQKEVVALTKEEVKARQRARAAAMGTAVATGAMAAGMLLTLKNSDGVANSIGQFLVVSSVVVPAFAALAPLIGKSAVAAKTLTVSTWTAAAGAKGMAASVRAAAVAFYAALSPVMLLAGLLAGIGVLYFALEKRSKKISEEAEKQRKIQAGIVTQTDRWAAGQDDIVSSYKQYQKLRSNDREQTQFDETVTFYRSDDEKDKTAAFNDMSAGNQQYLAETKYIELIKRMGLTADEAEVHMKAFFYATGMGATDAATQARRLNKEMGDLSDFDWKSQVADGLNKLSSMLGTQNGEELTATGRQFGRIFQEGFLSASGPAERQEYLNMLNQTVLEPWNAISAKIMADDSLPQSIRDQGEKGGAALRAEFMKMDKESRDTFLGIVAESGGSGTYIARDLTILAENADELERSIYGGAAAAGQLGDNVDTAGEFTRDLRVQAQLLTYEDAVRSAISLRKGIDDSERGARVMGASFGLTGSALDDYVAKIGEGKRETAFATINAYNLAHGYAEGSNVAKALANLMNKTKVETASAAGQAAILARELQGVEVGWRMTPQEATDMQKNAMEATQQSMADEFRNDFDETMDTALEARQNYWDKREESLDKSIERQKAANEAMTDRENRQFDNKWERKNDQAEQYWDNRIKKIDDAIKAEQAAEDKRKKMFDAEMARISKLNEAMNRNIDFNVALNSGNFDEAAKIRNDITADATETALETAANAGTGRSERRVSRLEGKKENAEASKDVYMKRLEKQEAQERRHLDKIQKMRERALDRQAERQKNALKRESENDMKAQRKIWDFRKKNLEKQLDLFLSYVAKNEKDLRKHIKNVGLAYTDFGKKLMNKGDVWSEHFGKSMKQNIRKAGMEMYSDKMWEKLGSRSLKQTLKGMGFDGGMAEFRHFISTGEMGGSKGNTKKINLKPSKKGNPGTIQPSFGETRHEGGEIGSGMGSRKGIARTTRGLHNSETLVRAQKGEFMVNKDAYQKNAPLIQAVNAGANVTMNASPGNKGYGHGGYGTGAGGAPGLASGIANAGIAAGIAVKMQQVYAAKQAEMAAMSSGLFSAGMAGLYGDRNFSAEQLANAATIASVGSGMGMSARDIMIGIMTAITESGLINIHGGDRDSQGLFQQRPSQGWGTVAQVTDPTYAATKFFEALKGISGRASMDPWVAAQSVQRSAFSDGSNYRTYWDEANAIFNRGLVQTPAYGGAPGDRKYNLPGVKPWVNEAAQYLGNKFNIGTIGGVGGRPNASDHPSGHALDFMTSNFSQGDALAAEVIRIHDDLDATYAIWRQRITSANGGWGKWRPMEDRGSPTANHMDHVHVSFDRTGDLGDLPSLGDTGLMGPQAATGRGGLNKPSVPGKGWTNSHDYRNGPGTPLYAYNNGVVTASKATTSGGSSGNGKFRDPISGRGYTSYGETITIRGDDGSTVLYAHLSPGKRFVQAGNRVRGGQLIGLSGETGNAWGAHTHFTTNGNYDAKNFFAGKGIPLKTGGTIKRDGVPAVLHKGERVLTANLTKKLDDGINNIHQASKDAKNKTKKPSEGAELFNPQPKKKKKQPKFVYPGMTTGEADSPYTWFDTTTLNDKKASDVNASATNAAMNLRTGTYNVKFSSSNQATQGDLSKLFKMADILSLTEMANGKRGVAPWMQKQGWGYYSPNTKVHNETGIAWNKSVMDMIKGGTVAINPKNGGHHGWDTHRAATYGLFQKKDNGAQFWQIAAHTVGRAQAGNPGAEAIMQEQYSNIGKLVERLNDTGKPVILAGDLNTAPERHKYKFNFENLVDTKSHSLDRMLASKQAKLTGQKRIGGLTSDHMALLSQYNIPSLSKGAENIKWDNTIANLHKGESVLTKDISQKFRDNVNNYANSSGNGDTYDVKMFVQTNDGDQLYKEFSARMAREKARKPGSRKN